MWGEEKFGEDEIHIKIDFNCLIVCSRPVLYNPTTELTGKEKPHEPDVRATRTPPRWPDHPTCELVVEEWKALMEETKLLPEYQHILDGIEFGFDQGIPDHSLGDLQWFTPDNHSSALKTHNEIMRNLEKEKREGRIFGPFSHEEVHQRFGFFRSNPMGSVVNKDGSSRMINDLSYPARDMTTPSVNSMVDKHDFDTSWDKFAKVAEYLREVENPILLAIFDWKKAYRQIPTAKHQWRFLTIKDFEGRIWIDTRVAFGGVGGCGTFGRVADVWRMILSDLLRIEKMFRWVDDVLIVKSEGSSLRLEDIVTISSGLGVVTNKEKLSDFGVEQKYLGFIWDGQEKSVRLPIDKLEARKEIIRTLLDNSKKMVTE